MALFGWLRRLFKRTAATPPAMPAKYRPAGLERPDSPETLIPPRVTPEAAPETHADALPIAQSEAPPERADPPPRVTVTISESAPGPPTVAEDHPPIRPKQTPRPRETDGLGEALDDDVYGLTFAIEYEAANGDFSRRRIMLRSVSMRDDGAIFLRALCFERNALRAFRLDRVQRIIDSDGVVHEDATAFLRDELRLVLRAPAADAVPALALEPVTSSLGTAAKDSGGSPDKSDEKPGVAQRRITRDGLRVLCALGRADGLLHPAEVEVVLDYIEAACRVAGKDCGAEDRAALAPYVRRQRPGLDILETCLQRIEAGDRAARSLLLDHAERLIAADGEEHAAELRLLAEMRQSE